MEAIETVAAGSNPWIGVGRAVGSTVVGCNIVAAEALGHNIVVDSLCFAAVDNNSAVEAVVDSLCTGAADSTAAVAAVDSLCSEAVDSYNFGVVGNNTVVAVVGSLCSEAVGSTAAVAVVAATADRSDNKAADWRSHNLKSALDT
jgi:hypothetical protein